MKYAEAKEEINNRISIVDVISRYVPLKRSGSNYMGVCPFHEDKNPSMSVSESRKRFQCWACHEGGTVYYFLSKYLGITYFEAVKMLAKEIGIEIENDFKDNEQYKALDEKKKKIYEVNKDAANQYYRYLFSDIGKNALEYLVVKRKLTKETIKKFGLGYAPKNTIDLYNILKEKGHNDEAIFDSTLFKLNDENKIQGFFFDRIIFPVLDIQRNILGFQSRTLDPNSKMGKYVNSKDNIVFKKDRTLFGYNFAFRSKFPYYIICEGNMDVISLNQAGFDNAVAGQGTAFGEKQIDLFKRNPKSKKIYLCQDMDEAGIKAKNAAAVMLEKAGFDTYAIDLSPVKDVDELINDDRYGVEELNKRFENPIPSILYYVKTAKLNLNLDDPNDYEKYLNLIVAKLAAIKNDLIRDQYIKKAALQENIDSIKLTKLINDYIRENNLNSDYKVKNVEKEYLDVHNDENDVSNNKSSKYEKPFVSLVVALPEYREEIKNIVNVDEIKDAECKFIYNKYLEGNDINMIYDIAENENDEEKKKKLNYILNYEFNIDESNKEKIKDTLNNAIRNLKIDNLNSDSTSELNDRYERNIKIREIKSTVYLK